MDILGHLSLWALACFVLVFVSETFRKFLVIAFGVIGVLYLLEGLSRIGGAP